MTSQLISVFIPILTFILMCIVGMELTIRDFIRIKRFPVIVILSIFGQILLLPLLCIAIIYTTNLATSITIGILLLAISPGGAMSNLYTYLFKGNVALSITMTTLSTVLAVLYIPVLGVLFLQMISVVTTQQTLPATQIILQLFLLLLMPVALGLFLRAFFEKIILSSRTILQSISLFGILGLLFLIFLKNADKLSQSIIAIAPSAVAFTVLSILIGFCISTLSSAKHPERIAIMLEFGVRNIPIALVLSATLKDNTETQLFAASYFVINACIILIIGAISSNISKKARFGS